MRTRMGAIVLVGVIVISAVPLTAAQTTSEPYPDWLEWCYWAPFDPPGPEPIPFPTVPFERADRVPVPMPGYRPMPVEPNDHPMPWQLPGADDPAEPPDLCDDDPRNGY